MAEIWKWMRPREPGGKNIAASYGKEKPWSWEREITSHFANLSPIMRGGFPSRKRSFFLFHVYLLCPSCGFATSRQPDLSFSRGNIFP